MRRVVVVWVVSVQLVVVVQVVQVMVVFVLVFFREPCCVSIDSGNFDCVKVREPALQSFPTFCLLFENSFFFVF